MPILRRRSILFAALAAFAFSTTSDANHSWGGYHWARTSNPFTLKTGNNVNGTWEPYLFEAQSDWNKAFELNLDIVTEQAKGKNCRPTAGRIEVCNAAYGNNGWLGIAQIWITGSVHITQGTTKVNDTYFNTSTYNTPAWRRLVMCQEVAHDFGLDHQDETFNNVNRGSCMDYTNDPDGGAGGASNNDPSNEHPNQHDFAEISDIYRHLDSFTTIGAAAPGPAEAADVEHPSAWGRLMRSSRNGRVQVFERDFGRGNKVITHVFWADPEGDAHGLR
jgi:hypothetical protein